MSLFSDSVNFANVFFIGKALEAGEDYSAALNGCLNCIRREKRWSWADERFLREAAEVYAYFLNHPLEKEDVFFSSFESTLSRSRTGSPYSPPDRKNGYLKLYLGEE